MPETAEEQKKSGRKPGAKGRDYETATVVESRCPKCKSTDRSEYSNKTESDIVGVENGVPFNTVVWRTCQCLACGQWRRDRSTEFRVVEERD